MAARTHIAVNVSDVRDDHKALNALCVVPLLLAVAFEAVEDAERRMVVTAAADDSGAVAVEAFNLGWACASYWDARSEALIGGEGS